MGITHTVIATGSSLLEFLLEMEPQAQLNHSVVEHEC
jgi:hypothetical protein